MILTQALLNFQYEQEKKDKSLTAMAGIGVYFDLFKILRVVQQLNHHLGKCEGKQGYRDSDVVLTIILINLVGGDCVEDVDRLEADEGLRRLFAKLIGKKWRNAERFRRDTGRTFPSQSVIFRYLERFDDGTQGEQGQAVKPTSIAMHARFLAFNHWLMEVMNQKIHCHIATLDQDATLIETYKAQALFGYKGYKAYQPLNVFWHELCMMLHTEFRPGNINANFDLLTNMKEALAALPSGVVGAQYRADGAGYNHELLKYLDAEKGDEGDEVKKRFGRIKFCVSAPITEQFRAAVLADRDLEWRQLDFKKDGSPDPRCREWAEVCYVPNELAKSKKGREYRYLVTRQVIEERVLPGVDPNRVLPFPTIEINRQHYKIYSVVTNGKGDGGELIHWHDQRCGRSEEVHSILKSDLAGGMMPSGRFGANAAWWWCSILTYNLHTILTRVAMDKDWHHKRMKAFRFHLINLPGRLVMSGNVLTLKLAINQNKFEWLLSIRMRLLAFARGPCTV